MNGTMKAAVLKGPGLLEVMQVPILPVGPNDILLKVKYCAVCGSDVHNYVGEPFKEGQIMGHEFVGVVVEKGELVEGIPHGMRGTGFSIKTCGTCYHCLRGRPNLCPDLFENYSGYGVPGAFAEYVHITNAKLGENFFEIPDSISDEAGALIEPVGVAVHVVSKTRPKPGDNIMIQGGGPQGNLVAQAMKGMDPGSIVVTDLFEERRQYALDCGATAAIDARADVLGAYQDMMGAGRYSRGTSGIANIVVEASGNPGAIALSFKLARSGGMICQLGIASEPVAIDVELMNLKSLTYIGFAGSNMPKAIVKMASGEIQPERIITHRFGLDEINEAFHAQQNDPRAMKVLIKMED